MEKVDKASISGRGGGQTDRQTGGQLGSDDAVDNDAEWH